MAKKASLNLEVDVVNNTASGLKEVEESVAEVADNMSKSAKKPSKNWGGVLELFTGALPRGFQKSIRQFKSVRRSVGRLSKSFSVLKISIAALGLPALILAVEALANNWQSVTDFLGFTSKANRQAAEDFKEISGSIAAVNLQGDAYLDILYDQNASQETQLEAIKALNSEFGNAIDLEADLSTQKRQAIKLIATNNVASKNQIDLDQKKRKLLEVETLLLEAKNRIEREGGSLTDEELKKQKEKIALQNEVNDLTSLQLQFDKKLNDQIEDNVKLTKDREKTEKERIAAEEEAKRNAAAEEKKRLAQQEADREFVQSARADAEQKFLDATLDALIENEDEKLRAQLERQQEREIKELQRRGATDDDLFALRENHQAALDAFDAEVAAREKEKKDAEAAEQKVLLDELNLNAMSESARRLKIIEDEYTKRKELAVGNTELLEAIERQHTADLLEITEEGEADRANAISQAQDMLVKNSRSMFAALERTAEEGSAAQKSFAIADVLLQQAVAMANAVAGATKAAADKGPAAPFLLAAYIASMIGTVLTSFVSIKGILAEADAPTGGVGGGEVTATRPLVPTNVARTETIDSPPSQAFIVQSELQGASLINDNLYGQTSLNPG